MARYHIGKNGPAPCRATKGKCPLGGASGNENHYDSIEEAYAAEERRLTEEHNPMEGAESFEQDFKEDSEMYDYVIEHSADYEEYEKNVVYGSGDQYEAWMSDIRNRDFRDVLTNDREALIKSVFEFEGDPEWKWSGAPETIYITAKEEIGPIAPRNALEEQVFDEEGQIKEEYEDIRDNNSYSISEVEACRKILDRTKDGRKTLAALDSERSAAKTPEELIDVDDKFQHEAWKQLANGPDEMYARMAILKLDDMGDPSPQEDREFLSMLTADDPDNWRSAVGDTPEKVEETRKSFATAAPAIQKMYEAELSRPRGQYGVEYSSEEWRDYYKSIGQKAPSSSEDRDPAGASHVARNVNARTMLLGCKEGREAAKEAIMKYGYVDSDNRRALRLHLAEIAPQVLTKSFEAKLNKLCDERLAELRGA